MRVIQDLNLSFRFVMIFGISTHGKIQESSEKWVNPLLQKEIFEHAYGFEMHLLEGHY